LSLFCKHKLFLSLRNHKTGKNKSSSFRRIKGKLSLHFKQHVLNQMKTFLIFSNPLPKTRNKNSVIVFLHACILWGNSTGNSLSDIVSIVLVRNRGDLDLNCVWDDSLSYFFNKLSERCGLNEREPMVSITFRQPLWKLTPSELDPLWIGILWESDLCKRVSGTLPTRVYKKPTDFQILD